MKYRGYYIDGVVFSSKADIDEFVKKSIIANARVLNNMMLSGRYTEGQVLQLSDEISIKEHRLHYECGMSYEDIELAIYA